MRLRDIDAHCVTGCKSSPKYFFLSTSASYPTKLSKPYISIASTSTMPLPSSHALPLLRFTALQRSIHSPLCLSSHSSSKHPHAFTNLTPSHHVSSSSTSKNSSKRTGSLAKPDRFRPPSHPSGREHALAAAARRRRNPFADGPPLSSAERIAQKVRRYPNTFPAKGTVTRKVLTNRMLHVWVSLVRC